MNTFLNSEFPQNIQKSIKIKVVGAQFGAQKTLNRIKVAMLGTGYVGLVSGTCFAETGNDLICVDIDQ